MTGATGVSPAFLRVIADMNADAAAATANAPPVHDGGPAGGGNGDAVGGDSAAAQGGDQGGGAGAQVAAIDDAEAFHLKTVSGENAGRFEWTFS